MKFDNHNNIYLSQQHPNCLVRSFIFFFCVMSFFLVFSENISAMHSSQEEEEKLYQKGLTYQNENKWLEAIECFKPLAGKKDIKAQHNLAFCFFNAGDESAAYHWYQAASEQGFVPSKNNLGQMNLLYLLLPNELISYIASFFTLKDLSCFNTLSDRAHWLIRSVITRTNFLSSKSPFAIEFLSLFNNVQFEPKPKEMRLLLRACVNEGSVEVHFRDSEHLRNIVEETPLIKVQDRLYFVHDSNAQDDKELVPTKGNLQEVYFVNFVSDVPLKVSGKIDSRNSLWFPEGSDINALMGKTKGLSFGKLTAYTKALALADALEKFDEKLLSLRTANAYQLLADRQKSRLESPSIYPDFFDLCPGACFITGSKLEIIQADYLSAEQPLIYISKSIADITELRNELPDFSASISYIDTGCCQSGVYCKSPLILQKGFEVYSSGHLIQAGNMELSDYNLKLVSLNSMWIVGRVIKVSGVYLKCGGSTFQGGTWYARREANKKPVGMPEEDWQALLTFWLQTGFIH